MLLSAKKNSHELFSSIECDGLEIRPKNTYLKWDSSSRTQGVRILGTGDIVKFDRSKVEKGILGKEKYIIGTDTSKWYYDMFVTGKCKVGMALDVLSPTVSKEYDVIEGDRIHCDLKIDMLTLIHRGGDRKIKSRTKYVISPGEVWYHWASVPENESISIRLMLDSFLTVSGDLFGNISIGPIVINNDGTICLKGGIKYNCTEVTSPGPYQILPSSYLVTITNPSITEVFLPLIPDTPTCGSQYIIVVRNYPLQPGESFNNPLLKIKPFVGSGDTLEGLAEVPVPPDTKVELICNPVTKKWELL